MPNDINRMDAKIWKDRYPGIFRLAGFTGPQPRIPGIVELKTIKDKPALRAQLEEWAALPNLQRALDIQLRQAISAKSPRDGHAAPKPIP